MTWVNFRKAFIKTLLMSCIGTVIVFKTLTTSPDMLKQITSTLLRDRNHEFVTVIDEYLTVDWVQQTHSKIVSMISSLFDEKMKKIEKKLITPNKQVANNV